jgi:hypothetical protein
VGLNYWITQVPRSASTDLLPAVQQRQRLQLRDATGQASPYLTEYQWGAAFNSPRPTLGSPDSQTSSSSTTFTYGGVGALSTRPIPTIDPDNRSFSWEPKLHQRRPHLRLFFNLVRDLEVQTTFADRSNQPNCTDPTNPSNWWRHETIDERRGAAGRVDIHSVLLDYRLPK